MPAPIQLKSAEPIELSALRERIESDSKKVPGASRYFTAKADGRVEIRAFSAQAAHNAEGVPPVASAEALAMMAKEAGIEWAAGYEKRVKRYIASTQEPMVDFGDVVMQNWDMKVFSRNPQMPYNHDWTTTIGAHLQYGVVDVRAGLYAGPALYTHAFFAPKEVSDLADQKFRLVEAGLLKGISATWYPLETVNVKDPDERARLGLGPYGIVFQKNKLIEMSPTPLPRVSSGLLQAASFKASGEDCLRAGDMELFIAEVARFVHEFTPAGEAREREIAEARGVAAALFPERSWSRVTYSIPSADPASAAAPAKNVEIEALTKRIDDLSALVNQQHSAIVTALPKIAGSISDLRALVEDRINVSYSDPAGETAPAAAGVQAKTEPEPNPEEVRAANLARLQKAFANS